MRLTKTLEAILKHYNVALREHDTEVAHALTDKKTICDPLLFAVFECAIKAQYLAYAHCPTWAELCEAGYDRHFAAIAHHNDFELLYVDGAADPNEKKGKRAAADYNYCANLIRKEGQYFNLLD